MTTKAQLRKAIAKHPGAELVEDGFRAEAIAPPGHIWSSDHLHCLVGWFEDGEPIGEVWADLMERVVMGVEPCEDQNCDWC
jgi:hypothetical protein